MITGPNLDQRVAGDLSAKAGAGVSFFPTRHDFRELLAGAQLSISQAGYNTAADILRAGCRSIMVPYASGGETEQTLRSAKLAERGRISTIAETELTPEVLAAAIDERIQSSTVDMSPGIDLGGAGTSARILLDEETKHV